MGLLASVILSTLLVVFLAVMRDLPVVNGAVLASGAGERQSFRLLGPLVLIAGLTLPYILPGDPLSNSASAFRFPSSSGILPVGIATAAAAYVAGRLGRLMAVPFAFIASLAGVSLSCTGQVETQVALSYLLSWLVAPVLCALLAAGIYRMCAITLRNKRIHLAKLDARLQGLSIVASFLLLAAFSANYSLLFSFIPKEAPVSNPLRVAITVGCAVVAYLSMSKEVTSGTWNIADYELDVDSRSIFSVILSMALTFALFTSGIPGKAGMAATPVPAGILFVSALVGISVTRGRALTDANIITGTLVSAILAPVFAFTLAYCLGKVIDGTAIGLSFALFLTALATGVVVFFHWRNERDIQRQILWARERQAFSARKSLSALEVKTEMTEKDLLNKLDIKRKELVDFALGISDQKRFMESFYEDLKEVRSMPDGEEKDARTDSLLASMRERMYFTSEMNDFYARSEVLHRDFNLRLTEAYPNLTENERKLANLLRQGFSSKYIASLMNITPKSVEINRYRLRAKLGLQRSDNLIKFIRTI